MNSMQQGEKAPVPAGANFVVQGNGMPVVLVHGLAASLHDWDSLVPHLAQSGYAAYALDLLGHGESPKPADPLYSMDWLVAHFISWLDSLALQGPPVLIGHSLGGFVALEYARRFPGGVRGLVLVDPFFSNDQLPPALRLVYAHPAVGNLFTRLTPRWLVRAVIDAVSLIMGHRSGSLHALTADVRAQTAVDYMRTAPAVYGVLKGDLDLRPYLPDIDVPTLVVWGERDGTLAPSSFQALVRSLPDARGISSRTGHVPHQAEPGWFNTQVVGFLESLGSRPVSAATLQVGASKAP